MANGHGGARKGAGNKKGAKRQVTEEAIKRAAAGETPLEYMLKVMRDSTQSDDRRDRMAVGAAPYVHAKLSSMEHKGDPENPVRVVNEIILRGVRSDAGH